jgi:thymidylate synthase
MFIARYSQFSHIIRALRSHLLDALSVDVGEWQARVDPTAPHSRTLEIQDVSFEYLVPPGGPGMLNDDIEPSQPWADEHFTERISGAPLNPPPSHAIWPFNTDGNAAFTSGQQFSHTYPERFWPKEAGRVTGGRNYGIRYEYGDLNDLVSLLRSRPATRQAYLPVWFPEDLAMTGIEARVPCTLGYHFLIRGGKLSVRYYMRSCDFLRHFRDDVYLAILLGRWVAAQVNPKLHMTHLIMHISSLHVFEADRKRLQRQAELDNDARAR